MIEKLLPARLHRVLLPAVHSVRHRWRRFRKTPLAGVSVIISNLDGDVLMLRHSYGPNNWALPGGGLKPNESSEIAARREVAEELSLKLEAVTCIGTLEESISGCPHTAHVFTATAIARPVPDHREVVEARFFPSHSLPEPMGVTTRARIAMWKARGT